MADMKEHDNCVEHIDAQDEDPVVVLDTSKKLKEFEKYQRSLTLLEACKEEWKPLIWCMYMFFVCIMFGFDGLTGGIVVSIAAFRKDFGHPYGNDYVVDANWQLIWVTGTIAGLVFGGIINGLAVARWGRQLCLASGFLLNLGGVFLEFFATTSPQFFGGKLLIGLSLGCFTTVAPTYASEMAPLCVRGAITAGMNFAIVLGQLLAYGVVRQAALSTGKAQYRTLFATQWGLIGVGVCLLPFFPESPYWLISHGNDEKARQNVTKLHKAGYDVEGKMEEIRDSLARMSQENASQGSLRDCFSKKQMMRTLVAVSMFFIQNASGSSWVIGYMSYFMQLGGMTPTKAFDTTVGLSGVMVVGNMCGWYLVERLGRRGSALWGCIILTVALLLIGILACIKAEGAIWGQVALMAVWSFVYQGTLGSAAWPICAENPTSRLRSTTQGLATTVNGLSGSIWTFALPYAINPDKGNMGGKIAFVFGGTLFCCTIFVFFLIPETKGRTYIEIDELWLRKTSPRKFDSTSVVMVAGGRDDK